MIPIIEVRLSPDDRRALSRAATKAALAAGMSLDAWRRHRERAPITADLTLAMGGRGVFPTYTAAGDLPAGVDHDAR